MKKNILFITYYYSSKISSGAEYRLYNLLGSLLNDHEITWLSHLNEKDNIKDVFFSTHKNLSFKIAPPIKKRNSYFFLIAQNIYKLFFYLFGNKKIEQFFLYRNVIKVINSDPNLLNNQIVFLNYFAFDKFIKYLKDVFTSIPIFIDTNDVQYERYSQIYRESSKFKYLLKLLSLKRFEIDEKRALKKINYVISLSLDDQKKFIKLGCSNVINIPQGLTISNSITIHKSNNNIAFFGAMGGTANISAAKYFKYEIFPFVKRKVSDVKYYIVGSNPHDEILRLKSEETIVTGFVENVEDFFKNIKCIVCPFNFSYGQRTRILEVMSYGIPCVVTSKAVEGMELENQNGIFIEDDEQKFAEIVTRLLIDDEFRIKQSRNAYDYIKNNFSIENTFKRLSKIITEI